MASPFHVEFHFLPVAYQAAIRLTLISAMPKKIKTLLGLAC